MYVCNADTVDTYDFLSCSMLQRVHGGAGSSDLSPLAVSDCQQTNPVNVMTKIGVNDEAPRAIGFDTSTTIACQGFDLLEGCHADLDRYWCSNAAIKFSAHGVM